MIIKRLAFIFCCLFVLIGATYKNPTLIVDYKYKKDLKIAQTEAIKTKKFFKEKLYFVDDYKIDITFIHYIKTKGKGRNKQFWVGWYEIDSNKVYIASSNLVYPIDRLGISERNGAMRHEIAHAIFYQYSGCKSIPEHEYIAAIVEIAGYPKAIRDKLIKTYVRSDYDSYFHFANAIRNKDKRFLKKLMEVSPEHYYVYSYQHHLHVKGYTFNDVMNNGEF